MAPNTTHYTVVIVGAGLQGLIAAKTFLQCEPSLDLHILDSAPSIGGVWKKESLYPELRTNNERDSFAFSDFPLPDDLGVKVGENIPGPAVNEYLQRYAEKHDLPRRCSLDTKVESVERMPDSSWRLQCRSTIDLTKSIQVTCSRLVVATGLTSSPAPLELRGSESFQAPIVNFASLAIDHEKLLDPSVKNVTVLGSGKAAFDTVYLLAKHGKNITWIMRASGHGPTWMSYTRVWFGPVKLWIERVVTSRLVSFLSPCVWGPADGFGWIRSCFHNTRVGRWIVQGYFGKLSHETLYQTGLLGSKELQSLIPRDNGMWYGVGFSALNYPTNIHDFIRSGQVRVISKDISTLSAPNQVNFVDGSPSARTDALVCSMGWSYALPFELKPHTLHATLGIPSSQYTSSQSSAWSLYDSIADTEVLSRFPAIASAPRPSDKGCLPIDPALAIDKAPQIMVKNNGMTPWRLWRGIAPPGYAAAPANEDRNIVFLGMLLTLSTMPRSEVQALWAWAWMKGCISPEKSFQLTTNPGKAWASRDLQEAALLLVNFKGAVDAEKSRIHGDQNFETSAKVLQDTTLFNRGSRLRYPYGHGQHFPDFMFDGVAYLDLLLRDLGVRHWRKGKTMLGEIFSTGYMPEDYRDIIDEWRTSVTRK